MDDTVRSVGMVLVDDLLLLRFCGVGGAEDLLSDSDILVVFFRFQVWLFKVCMIFKHGMAGTGTQTGSCQPYRVDNKMLPL